MSSISINIPGAPVPKGRPRFAKIGRFMRAYTPKETEVYETRVRWCVTSAMARDELRAFDCAISVTVDLVMPIPESWSKRKQGHAETGVLMPTGRPDADNCAKSILDAANGHLWRDDSQIVELIVRKRYGTPGVLLTVSPWVQQELRLTA